MWQNNQKRPKVGDENISQLIIFTIVTHACGLIKGAGQEKPGKRQGDKEICGMRRRKGCKVDYCHNGNIAGHTRATRKNQRQIRKKNKHRAL
jgi:hypothetical protein